ncbi:transposase [Streptomyces sp. AP-93]|uniref:IS701 family transposase n=1 Tax=Streptomyces sp. AP-93 TaxID=2929048 RepID=UPI001FAF6BBC|nr:transposase [Streptomyces sp. AP-93]MCJ0868276.1 transposase [Streptomyces sp. AP-93]
MVTTVMNTIVRRELSVVGPKEVRATAVQIRRDPIREMTEDLCDTVFASLRRKDQREKALRYVRGLLATSGRKSIRSIAAHVEGDAAEQSLHHFIFSSTWDWQPLRTALSGYLESTTPLTAWVAQPMAIPKGGEHSVGVGHHFDPHQGQMFRGQQAFGTWFTSPEVATPVGWRLFVPDGENNVEAAANSVRRSTGSSPEPTHHTSYEECAASGVIETVKAAAMPARPVVLDVRNIGTRPTMNRFAEAKIPVMARISPISRLLVTDPALPGYGAGPLNAGDILQSLKGLRAPVEWVDPVGSSARRSTLAVAVGVMMPDPSAARRRQLVLVGEWADPHGLPTQLWITDLTRMPVGRLLRLTKQATRVALTSQRSGQELGLRDYAGRSLHGWHRHVTLASIAHAAHRLAAARQQRS